jgi:hypothetical protein
MEVIIYDAEKIVFCLSLCFWVMHKIKIIQLQFIL